MPGSGWPHPAHAGAPAGCAEPGGEAVTLGSCRGLAVVERRATEAVLGHPLAPHHYRVIDGRLPGRMLRSLGDPQLWRDLLHAVLGFPVRLATSVVAVGWTLGGPAELLYAGWQWSLPQNGDVSGLYGLITGTNSNAAEIVLNTIIGVVMVATSPLVVRGLVAVRAGLARWLLTNENAALRARTTTLETSRRAAVDAEAQTLRRVERDIHDGPQQRLAPAVENSAYFVVAEALTNVAKHPDATRCAVAVRIDAQRVQLRVEDDGVVGAHPGKGSGPAGLADLLAAVEGTFDVLSTTGGPTVLTAEIPLVGVGA